MLLKIYSKSDDVKKMQSSLGLKPDGDFGPITEQKVKEWQAKNSLPVTGIIDDKCWKVMFAGASELNNFVPEGKFNLDKLKGLVPDEILQQIPDTAVKFNINSNLRLAHFLAQCAHESGGFKLVNENMNYSPERLKVKFSKYIPDNLLDTYARKPEKIGARVYANRNGNGDEASGEGFTYRGRGYIQLTGKDNYKAFSGFVNDDCVSNPDLVANKYPLASAGFFFNTKNGLLDACDKGDNEDAIKEVTLKVNGGFNGLDDRANYFKKFYSLLK
ncbi:MAG TPA: peptidoglycan-binding protein [Bacteroidales bacterium]